MFAAVAGFKAAKRIDDGVSKTGWRLIHRVDDVSVKRREARHGGDVRRRRVGQRQERAAGRERGTGDLRGRLVDAEAVLERRARPGSGGWSTWPTTTACTCWKPSGKRGVP